ncbi:MAG: DUF305 domain-containing protein [Dehalococcoidia bacterium]
MVGRVRFVLVLAGLLGVAALSACEWWRSDEAGAESPFMGITDPASPYDQRFIDEMVMHHQGAIVSARMMIAESERPELRDLARRIIDGQQRQIERMRAWREQWFGSDDVPAMGMDPMAGMMGRSGMAGMMGGMMQGEMTDRMFLRMMIPHHQLAIDMAEDAVKNAQHEELKDLAREIIAEQSAEIEEMERYLREWYGESSTRDTADDMREMMRRMLGR